MLLWISHFSYEHLPHLEALILKNGYLWLINCYSTYYFAIK